MHAGTGWTSCGTGSMGADLRRPARRGKSGVQGPAEPVSFVLSSDFRKEQDQYEDIDNLFAMYLLYNLSKHRVRGERRDEVAGDRQRGSRWLIPRPPSLPPEARRRQRSFRRRLPFRRQGTEIGEPRTRARREPCLSCGVRQRRIGVHAFVSTSLPFASLGAPGLMQGEDFRHVCDSRRRKQSSYG